MAGTPKMINYQGMMTDNSGNPLTDTVSITFRIYDDSSAGNKKWEELQTTVPVINGLFNVILGSVVPIDTLSFSQQYWLDITVGAEHVPSRLIFTSVGYAYKAFNCDVALSAPRHVVHFPNLNNAYRGSADNQLGWVTIDKSAILLDLSQYGGPVKVSISLCGFDKTQLRVLNLTTGLGLDSTIVTGQVPEGPAPPHIIVTGSSASVSENTCLALQWRATVYGFHAYVQEVSLVIERQH